MGDKENVNHSDLTADVAIPLTEPAPAIIEIKPDQPVILSVQQKSILAEDSLY